MLVRADCSMLFGKHNIFLNRESANVFDDFKYFIKQTGILLIGFIN